MQDTALYQYLLGLQSPWTVSRVMTIQTSSQLTQALTFSAWAQQVRE